MYIRDRTEIFYRKYAHSVLLKEILYLQRVVMEISFSLRRFEIWRANIYLCTFVCVVSCGHKLTAISLFLREQTMSSAYVREFPELAHSADKVTKVLVTQTARGEEQPCYSVNRCYALQKFPTIFSYSFAWRKRFVERSEVDRL